MDEAIRSEHDTLLVKFQGIFFAEITLKSFLELLWPLHKPLALVTSQKSQKSRN